MGACASTRSRSTTPGPRMFAACSSATSRSPAPRPHPRTPTHLTSTASWIMRSHTAQAARRRGLGRAMLDHLLAVARERGLTQVSLETGSMEAFSPARRLYERAGFTPCEPFADYSPSRNSTFMTLTLSPDGEAERCQAGSCELYGSSSPRTSR